MSEPSLSQMKEAAMAYEALHVPALFAEWVEPVLDAASVGPGQRVLDVACGTGVLARGARARVGDAGRVVGLDPGPGMLAAAEELEPGITWRMGVAGELPFDDRSFDAVVSQFGMMFFPDRVRAVREMMRVVRDEGRLAVAVWDSLERTPPYALMVEVLNDMAGPEAADALRAPFVLGDPAELRSIFRDAGVDDVEVSSRTGTGRFPAVRTMVEADLRGWLPIMGVHLGEEQIEAILAEAESRLAGFVQPGGEVLFDSPAHIVSGRKGRLD